MSQGSSGEKTEQASPKKRRDAREKGQVLKSTEINTAFCSLIVFGFLSIMMPYAFSGFTSLLKEFLGSPDYMSGLADVNISAMRRLLGTGVWRLAVMVLPVMLCAMIAGIMINVIQVGFLFTTEPIKPKLERISPIKGFQRIFSSRTVVELLKSILKILLLGYILYKDYVLLLADLPQLMGADIYRAFSGILDTAFRIALKMAFTFALLAAADYLFQWWKFEKDLMMTKQEVKDEYKLTEGDPLIKSRIRQKQREMSQMRMMEAVPSADVVITNPTHFAVALQYKEGANSAPVVIAKGQDYLARKIKEKAAESGVEIVENKPLAQSLYRMCEVGDEIPPEFYQAVADVLVYVYRLKNKIRAVPGT